MKTNTTLVVALVMLSMVLSGCNADQHKSNGPEQSDSMGGFTWDESFLPKAKPGVNQNWQIKFTNNKSSKTSHSTDNSVFHHHGESGSVNNSTQTNGKDNGNGKYNGNGKD